MKARENVPKAVMLRSGREEKLLEEWGNESNITIIFSGITGLCSSIVQPAIINTKRYRIILNKDI